MRTAPVCAILAAVSSVFGGVDDRFPLEWSPVWPTDRPYEVEFDRNKMMEITGAAPERYRVEADGRRLDSVVMPGAVAAESVLRFTVPKGTRRLDCVIDDRAVAPSDSGTVENVLSRLLTDAGGWKSKGSVVRKVEGGMLFVSGGKQMDVVSCQVPCPPDMAGKPVFFEIELENVSSFAWGGKIFVRQTTGTTVLPETVVDSRWISHVRPAGKRFRVRTEGRVHPAAEFLRVEIQLPYAPPAFDVSGMPLAEGTDLRSKLLVSGLALRVGGSIPFPGYSDDFFSEDAEGRGGASFRFDGTRAFWYQTRSMASWGMGRQVFGEENVFYPFGEGTVEAWFKPGWAEADERTFTLFEAAHDGLGGILSTQATKPYGRMFALEYTPATGVWNLFFRDVKRKVFVAKSGGGVPGLPVGTWSHVAVQWKPGGAGEVFANGRRVLVLDLKRMRIPDVTGPKSRPNEMNPATCRIGASFKALSRDDNESKGCPLYVGLADAWRISTGKRYTEGFVPRRVLECDGRTRAFFGFDRSFDGKSGGGIGFVPGSVFAPYGRLGRDVRIGGRKAGYFPATLRDDTDPDKIVNRLNYPSLPEPGDFRMARELRRAVFRMKPGETADVKAGKGAVADWVEIFNTGNDPLVHPIVLNGGDVDPRSFTDIRRTLGLDGLGDRAKADRIFRYAVGAVDYFGTAQLTFDPGGDAARALSRDPLLHLNVYSGYECRMLNIMLASLFTMSGDMPSGLVEGYRHSYQQVYYDGENRVYDLSMQRFVPSFRNDEVASLGEIENEPGEIARCGSDYARFIRSGTRGMYASGPVTQRKMAFTLNPGERFRAWFANDGTANDLQCRARYGKSSDPDPDDRRKETCGYPKTGGRRFAIRRFDRVFPEFANGFFLYEGRPDAHNPAFTEQGENGFCYRVESPYPVVAAYYKALARDGRDIPLEISTDGGKSFRTLASGVRITYPVRARHRYHVRIRAPVSEVDRFEAETEVMLNGRVFPGKIREGENRLTLTASSGTAAEVSFGWREPGEPIEIRGGFHHGAIPGRERQTVLVETGRTACFPVSGVSSAVRAEGFGGVEAVIRDGMLKITDRSPHTAPRIAGVEIRDGKRIRTLGVIVASGARFADVSSAEPSDGARCLPADTGSVMPRLVFPANLPGARVSFGFPRLPAGRYQVYLLNRFASHPKSLNAKPLCVSLDGGGRIVEVGSPGARAYNYAKANFGHKGGRANWKWDVKWEFRSSGSSPVCFDMPDFDRIDCVVTGSCEAVEIAGVLVIPEPTRNFSCGLVRTLLGLNCQPELVRGRFLDGFEEYRSGEDGRPPESGKGNWLQSRIDAAHEAGGGTVVVPDGRWEIPSIRLKSGVRMHLSDNAVLLGSTNRADYAATGIAALIEADGVRDISITGKGVIDGRGAQLARSGKWSPPQLVKLTSCTNVLVENVRMRNAGTWMLQLRKSFGVTVRGAVLRSHSALCNDGIDVASSRVLIENCDIDTGDDAVVLKTFYPDHVVEDVTVRNCRLATGCNAFKIGTESFGTVRRVRVSDCTVKPPSELRIWKKRIHVPGLAGKLVGSSAIAIESVDGGRVEDIEVRGISGEGIQTPIFVRLGRRNESRRGEPAGIGKVLIEDVELKAGSRIACSITGVKGLRPSGIVLRNVRLIQRGGGTLRDVCVPVPEKERSYPENRMFDLLPLPAYGFYIRHADDVVFENVRLAYEGSIEERPAVFAEDATLSVDGKCRFRSPSGEFAGRAVFRPSVEELAALGRKYWDAIAVDGGFFSPASSGADAPLFVYCSAGSREQMQTAINNAAVRGWNVLLPSRSSAEGVLKALDSVKGLYDARRTGLKADGSALALELLAADPSRWAAVTVCDPGNVPENLRRASGVSVHIVAGCRSTGFEASCKAFNRLAAPQDRLSGSDIDRLKKNPDAWLKRDRPGRVCGYDRNSGRRIGFRRKSGNVVLSVCDAGSIGSFSPELDFLSSAFNPK